MRVYTLTFLIVTLAFFNVGATDFYSEKQAEKMAKIALKEKDISLKGKVELTDSLGRTEPLSIYLFEKTGGENFYVAFTQSKGRYDYFDYLVRISTDFKIEQVKILKYRSERGGEIASKKWLKQFVGHSTEELHYKREISAISGATISAGAITKDIPKVLQIVKQNCQ